MAGENTISMIVLTYSREFNELINMTAKELQDWLKQEQSQESGWQGESGETIGHERCVHMQLYLNYHANEYQISGRKIVDILSHNPTKNKSKYRDEDIEHMRRVVAYNKRHLAQEEKAKQDTSSKSYKSLKNWGHDALKA